MFLRGLLIGLLAVTLGACTSAPTKAQAAAAVKKVIPVSFEVLQVKELKEVSGLFEVVIRANKQPIVLYLDKKAQYVFSGSLMSLETKANLTTETQQKFLR
jgi:protein-disulfide isomerase